MSGKEFHGLTLSFPRKVLGEVSCRHGEDFDRFLDGRFWGLSCESSHLLVEFRTYLYQLFARSTQPLNTEEQALIRKQLDVQVPEQLLFAIASHKQERYPPLKTRQRGLRLALGFMDDQCQISPSMPEVCKAVGLSWRSLDRAFKESFGVGPKRYLLNLRLTRVRQRLKQAHHGLKVVDVANQWGFWHMGDFAREYQLMFGELLSRTLKR